MLNLKLSFYLHVLIEMQYIMTKTRQEEEENFSIFPYLIINSMQNFLLCLTSWKSEIYTPHTIPMDADVLMEREGKINYFFVNVAWGHIWRWEHFFSAIFIEYFYY